MGNLLNTIAILFSIIWFIGFIGYAIGGLIHLLLLIATIAIILRVVAKKNKLTIKNY